MTAEHTARVGGVELRFGAASDVGRVRTVNEDSFLVRPPVFVVADGMGGHAGGDVASRIAVEELAALAQEYVDVEDATRGVDHALAAAQRRIHEYAAGRRGAGQARWYSGTTVVLGLLFRHAGEPHWLLANLGDSRIYRLHDGALEQVSTDHSIVQELINAGKLTPQAAVTHPDRHVITRALGGSGSAPADFFLLPASEVDRLLLVSDGVTGELGPETLRDLLAGSADPVEAADRIVSAAVEAGGQDNATAVVVQTSALGAG